MTLGSIQIKFAKAGGQSGLRSVHTSPEYASYRPWNHAFGPSLDWQKDVWHVPEFFELLVQQQELQDQIKLLRLRHHLRRRHRHQLQE